MSLLQNLTVPPSTLGSSTTTRTPSASIKTDSLQPSANGSQVSVELRTPTSPTGSTLSGHSASASDKQSTRGSSQGESTTESQIAEVARRAALARRRHTVFITHNTKERVVSGAHATCTTGGDVVEGEQGLDEFEESGEFQDAERKAKKLHDDSVRQTQSMPLIVDDSTAAASTSTGNGGHRGIPSNIGKSIEYKRLMEEVKGQREQLLAFHSQQREEEELAELEEEMEGAKGGVGEDGGSTVEELQPMEGTTVHVCTCVHVIIIMYTVHVHTHVHVQCIILCCISIRILSPSLFFLSLSSSPIYMYTMGYTLK